MTPYEPIDGCQMTSMPKAFERMTLIDQLARIPRKIYWAVRRRIEHVLTIISRRLKRSSLKVNEVVAEEINAGDLVRVRSKEEIIATLNSWNEYKGCAFIDDMWDYCGTTQRVFKKVRNFVDERDYRTKRVKGLVILENVYCQGTRVLGNCDRSCFFFWREEWLEKIGAEKG
jgi:hypothetical protein